MYMIITNSISNRYGYGKGKLFVSTLLAYRSFLAFFFTCFDLSLFFLRRALIFCCCVDVVFFVFLLSTSTVTGFVESRGNMCTLMSSSLLWVTNSKLYKEICLSRNPGRCFLLPGINVNVRSPFLLTLRLKFSVSDTSLSTKAVHNKISVFFEICIHTQPEAEYEGNHFRPVLCRK